MKKIIISIVAVAVMALAAGCGNSGQTQSQTTAKSSTVQSKSSTAKSSGAQSKSSTSTSNAALRQTIMAKSSGSQESSDLEVYKKSRGESPTVSTYSDFASGDFSFSNIKIDYDWESTVTMTMTYNGTGEKNVENVTFKFSDEYGTIFDQGRDIKKTFVSDKGLEISFEADVNLTGAEKIEFVGVK